MDVNSFTLRSQFVLTAALCQAYLSVLSDNKRATLTTSRIGTDLESSRDKRNRDWPPRTLPFALLCKLHRCRSSLLRLSRSFPIPQSIRISYCRQDQIPSRATRQMESRIISQSSLSSSISVAGTRPYQACPQNLPIQALRLCLLALNVLFRHS